MENLQKCFLYAMKSHKRAETLELQETLLVDFSRGTCLYISKSGSHREHTIRIYDFISHAT